MDYVKGCSNRPFDTAMAGEAEAYLLPYVEALSEARTKSAACFNIRLRLAEGSAPGRSVPPVPSRRGRVPCQDNRTSRLPSNLWRFAWRGTSSTGPMQRHPIDRMGDVYPTVMDES